MNAGNETKNGATADGERYDPEQVAGAHQTLQLPVMLRVRNLENGRELLVRVNDRGPASPGRILSLTPRAAQLLGMDPTCATRVRVEESEVLSRDLLPGIPGAPSGEVSLAPLGAVQEQSLMPGRVSAPQNVARASGTQNNTENVLKLQGDDERVTMGPAEPGQLWIDAGHFSKPSYARRLATQLLGVVRQDGHGRSAVFNVRVGPFERVDEADAALDRARSAGVTGARIIVE